MECLWFPFEPCPSMNTETNFLFDKMLIKKELRYIICTIKQGEKVFLKQQIVKDRETCLGLSQADEAHNRGYR